MVERDALYNLIITKLRGLRAEKGYNLEDVSKELKINRSTLSCYEKGKRTLPVDKMIELLKFYEVDIDIFFKNIFYNSRRWNRTSNKE